MNDNEMRQLFHQLRDEESTQRERPSTRLRGEEPALSERSESKGARSGG